MLGIMKKAVPSNREDSTAFVVKSQPNFIAEQREVYHNIRPSDRVYYERVIKSVGVFHLVVWCVCVCM